MIPDTGEVFYASAANQNHRVFLQIMAYTGNIGSYFSTGGKPNPRHLAEGGIRFFGGNVITLVQVPLFWGQEWSAGDLVFEPPAVFRSEPVD